MTPSPRTKTAPDPKDAIKEKIRAQIAPLQAELNRIKDAEEKAKSVALVGRCFKYRNCYSCPKPDEYWWLYIKVTGMGEYWPVAFEFQTDKDGMLTVKQKECFSRMEGHNEIPASEFNAAWRKVQKRIAGTKP